MQNITLGRLWNQKLMGVWLNIFCSHRVKRGDKVSGKWRETEKQSACWNLMKHHCDEMMSILPAKAMSTLNLIEFEGNIAWPSSWTEIMVSHWPWYFLCFFFYSFLFKQVRTTKMSKCQSVKCEYKSPVVQRNQVTQVWSFYYIF